MSIGALPQLDHEDGVGNLVIDAHLVEEATHGGQRIVSSREVGDEFVTLAGQGAEGSGMSEGHSGKVSALLDRAPHAQALNPTHLHQALLTAA